MKNSATKFFSWMLPELEAFRAEQGHTHPDAQVYMFLDSKALCRPWLCCLLQPEIMNHDCIFLRNQIFGFLTHRPGPEAYLLRHRPQGTAGEWEEVHTAKELAVRGVHKLFSAGACAVLFTRLSSSKSLYSIRILRENTVDFIPVFQLKQVFR